MNLFALFQRAQQYESLAPHERALLKFVQGLLITAGVAALTALVQLVLNKGTVTWQEIWKAAAVAAIIAIANALIKYFTAKGDPELASVVKPVEAAAVARLSRRANKTGKSNSTLQVACPCAGMLYYLQKRRYMRQVSRE